MANAVTTAEFDSTVLKSDVPVLVDFWATWCGPCKLIGPSLDELSNEYSGKAKIVKVDVDNEGELATTYGIMSIPALVVFKGGQEVERVVGAMPKPELAKLLDRHI